MPMISGSDVPIHGCVLVDFTLDQVAFSGGRSRCPETRWRSVRLLGEASAATGVNGNQADNTASFAGAVYILR
jgi:hypothetical protein